MRTILLAAPGDLVSYSQDGRETNCPTNQRRASARVVQVAPANHLARKTPRRILSETYRRMPRSMRSSIGPRAAEAGRERGQAGRWIPTYLSRLRDRADRESN